MSRSIKIHELTKTDLKGSVLIDGFPGVGLVGTIVANFLINNLKKPWLKPKKHEKNL